MQTAPQPQPQPQPWKSTVGGVLTLVIGGLDALGFFAMVVIAALVGASVDFTNYIEDQIYPMAASFFMAWMIALAVVLAILAVLTILGGISALSRKRWGLALAGSIAAILGPWWPVGITALIFIAIGRDEFKS